MIIDEPRVCALVLAYQRADPELRTRSWRVLAIELDQFINVFLQSLRGDLKRFVLDEETRGKLLLKLSSVLLAYRPAKGALFSLLWKASENYLRTLRTREQRYSERFISTANYALDPRAVILADPYSLRTELGARLEHFTAPNGDHQFFRIRNLIAGAYREALSPPSIARLVALVAHVCQISPAHALERTQYAIQLLRNELYDLGGTTFAQAQSLQRNLLASTNPYHRLLARRLSAQTLHRWAVCTCELTPKSLNRFELNQWTGAPSRKIRTKISQKILKKESISRPSIKTGAANSRKPSAIF